MEILRGGSSQAFLQWGHIFIFVKEKVLDVPLEETKKKKKKAAQCGKLKEKIISLDRKFKEGI